MRKGTRLKTIVREFQDRGNQWLLESPENLRGLMLTVSRRLARRLDFTQAEQIPTRFIADSLRKHEADLLFRVPYRAGKGAGPEAVFVYLLVESQSTPDPSMGFRLLLYMVNIWDRQRRQWLDADVPVSQWRFLPIIPVVFYTGSTKWEIPISMDALMDLPAECSTFVPRFSTLMLNLEASEPDDLSASGHPFGRLLRVMKRMDASEAELMAEIDSAVAAFSAMAEDDRAAWEKAIYYLYLLVFHRRSEEEGRRISEKIRVHVEAGRGKKIGGTMAQTWAEALMERGEAKGVERGLQRALLNQVREKFGSAPAPFQRAVRQISDQERLDALLRLVLHASSLAEMEEAVSARS